MTDRPPHWLRTNRASRAPRRVVCFDSEAHREQAGRIETHRFRLACATFDKLDVDGNQAGETEYLTTFEPTELWGWIAGRTAQSHRTVAFAHKLDYDLRVTQALEQLPLLGWRCRGIGLNAYSSWARFSDGKRSLWLCDSLSWFPTTLERIAAMVGGRKTPLPDEDAPPDVWVEHCAADVDTLRRAILRLIRWLRTEDLGDFRLTGAAQATAAFRHRFLGERTLLVHGLDEPTRFEREAAHAGRAEAWRHGKITGPIFEWDYIAAYARIGQRLDVPCRLIGEYNHRPGALYDRSRGKVAQLAQVTVRTERPTVPAQVEGRTVWPVGEFRTVLWDTELDLLESEGGAFMVERLWHYAKGPLLEDWANWILAAVEGQPRPFGQLETLVCKAWSRSLIGRFALRYPLLEEFGTDDRYSVALTPVWDEVEQRSTSHLQLGFQILEQTGVAESGNSTPFVMSYVMARARVELWALMRSAGLENVLYCDTDGILVNVDGDARLRALVGGTESVGVRRKASYRSAELRGPRNLDVDDDRRVTGVPRKAARTAPGVYQAEVWESLPASLRKRRSSTVVLSERRYHVADRDPRRIHLPSGATLPLRLTLEAGTGANLAQPVPPAAALPAA